MVKNRKNYYKKPVGSVAVLGYYVVIPFYKKPAYLSSLQKTTENAEELVLWAVQQACVEIQASFVVGDQLFDDGLVEACPIVEDTHLSLYLKLPATVSVHSAVTQLRIQTSDYLSKTELSWYKKTYPSLFKTAYLAMCGAVDPTLAGCIHQTVYGDYLKTFFLENGLQGDPVNLHERRRKKFGKAKDFMSDEVTHYT